MKRFPFQHALLAAVLCAPQVLWAALHGTSRLLLDVIYMKSDFSEALCNGVADMLWREMQGTAQT